MTVRGIALEEIRDRHRQDSGDVTKTPGADAIGTFLVLLNLLKRDTERRAETLLGEAGAKPGRTNPQAHMDVDEAGFLGHGETPTAGKLLPVQTEVVTSRPRRQEPSVRYKTRRGNPIKV